MLILRTLLYGPAHGLQIGKHIQRTTNDFLQTQHGRSIPRYIGWSEGDGGPPNGRAVPTVIENSDTTGRPAKARNSWWWKSRSGRRRRKLWRVSCGPQR